MVAPEFVLGKAIGDFVAVWRLKQKMESWAMEDKVEWGLSHGFFAMVGGFRILDSGDETLTPAPKKAKEKEIETEEHSKPSDTIQDIIEIKTDDQPPAQNSNPTLTVESGPTPPPELHGQDVVNPFIISGSQIFDLRVSGDIERLPEITAAEIHDKGKSNAFTKVVAILQVFWVSVQVIVRSVRGLAVSQLELVTTAFSLCAIITYAFLIPKPQGVETPAQPIKIKSRSGLYNVKWYPLRALFLPGANFEVNEQQARIPNDLIDFINLELLAPYSFGMALGGAIFGAVHVAGWNLNFPSSVDRELWQISSVLMTVLLPVACLPLMIFSIKAKLLFFLDDLPGGLNTRDYFQAWGFIFGIFYMVTRLILLVETFRTLAFLPPDAFVSTWVSNIPNVS